MSENVETNFETHDQKDLHLHHWRERVLAWREDHAAMLADLKGLQSAMGRHLEAMEEHLDQIFKDEYSHITHDFLEQTPEGREIADWLRRAHEDYVEMDGIRRQLNERFDGIHEGAMHKLSRVVKVFES